MNAVKQGIESRSCLGYFFVVLRRGWTSWQEMGITHHNTKI